MGSLACLWSNGFVVGMLLTFVLCPWSWAQDQQHLRVWVSDPQGYPVVGAHVTGSDPGATNCTTDGSGSCVLPAGTFPAVDITAEGFTPQQLDVSAGTLEARVTMHIQSKVSVDVRSTELASPSSVQGSILSAEEVDRIPVWLRKLDSIQPLFPGVVPRPTLDEWGEGLSAAGSRSTMMNTVLDGMPNRAERRGGLAIKPPLEAISEFKVFTSGYSAEYGQTPGLQVVLTTKSGSDQIHGDIYNYARDRFGGMLGGPLQKGRTYYFASFERANTNFESPVTSNVLTPEQLRTASAATTPNQLGQTLLPLVPTSPDGKAKYIGEHSVENQFLVRLDRNIGDTSKLTARFAHGSGGQVLEPDTGNTIARDWPSLDDTSHSSVVSYSRDQDKRAFTVRASFLDSLGSSLSRCHYDPRYSVTLADATPTVGCPIIDIAGYPSFGDAAYLYTYRSQSADLGMSLSTNLGPHSLKLGISGTRLRYTSANPTQENGFLYFDGSHSGSAVTDFLLGLPAVALRDFYKSKQHGELVQTRLGGFVQNALRLGDSLIIDAGARMDFLPSMTRKSGDLTNFSPLLGVVESGSQRQLLRSQGLVVDPRLGFMWRPFGGQYVVRGGIGQYSGQDILSVVLGQLTAAPAMRGFITSIPGAGPLNAQSPAWTSIDSSVTRGIDPRNRVSRLYQYSLAVERTFESGLSLEAAYIGSKGLHLGRLFNINMALPTGAIDGLGNPVLERRYAAFGDIIYDDRGASSSYNAGRIRLQQRSRRGFNLSLSYTFSKSIDDASSTENRNWTGLPYAQDPRNLNRERAVSDFHHRHQFTGFVVVLLDKYTNTVVLRRAELSATVNMMSGLPFSPVTDGRYLYRPDIVSDPYADVPAGYFINPAAFRVHVPTAADPNYFGNAGRNSLSTPYFNTIDLAFNKGFRIKSRAEIKFRVEVFNLLSRRVPYIDHVMAESGFGRLRRYINEERHVVAGAHFSF